MRIRDRDLAILEIGPSETGRDMRSRLVLAELPRHGPPVFGDPEDPFGPEGPSSPNQGLTDVALLDDHLVVACAWDTPEGGMGELVSYRRSGALLRRVAKTGLPFKPTQVAAVGASTLVVGRRHGLAPYGPRAQADEGASGASGAAVAGRRLRVLKVGSGKVLRTVSDRDLPSRGILRHVTDCAVAGGWVHLALGNAGVVLLPTRERAKAMRTDTELGDLWWREEWGP